MGNENDKTIGFIDSKQNGCCDKFSLFISKGSTDQSDFTCPICFRIFLSPRILKCKHTFCEKCIQEWGKCNSMKCPLCRQESKRSRGSFGRANKRLQNRIAKLFLKCRNCSWNGSYCQFNTQFSIQPYLDDQQMKSEKVQQQKVEQVAQAMEQKKQVKEQIEQSQKQEVKVEVEKVEKVEKVENDQDEVVEVKMKKKREEYEIFFEPQLSLSDGTPFLFPLLPVDDGLGVLTNNNELGFRVPANDSDIGL